MIELLTGYSDVGPLATGLLLFPMGLMVGSFSSVVWHRLLLKQSVVFPRSHCLSCHHPLALFDLFPVLSFICLRGHCRYCRSSISWRYPALELGSGLLSAACGFAGGWVAGLAALLLWVAGVAIGTRYWRGTSEAGGTVLEVLLAVSLLVGVMVPMLDLRAVVTGATAFQRQIAVTLASSKVEEVGNYNYRTYSTWEGRVIRPENGCSDRLAPAGWSEDCPVVGSHRFRRQWVLSNPVPDEANTFLKQLTVVVTCNDCGRAASPVRVTTYLGKVPQ